ncbi:MAG: hypothetical protein ABI591_14450 [Kofleriaceae bacterium]
MLAVVTGCKSMGHIASGLGHASSGLGHVASGLGHMAAPLGHVASGAAHLAAPAAKIANAVLPIAEDIASGVINNALGGVTFGDDDTMEANADPQDVSMSGPLIDNHDPCNACPDDLPCSACHGVGEQACRWTPPGAFTRCESSVAAQ